MGKASGVGELPLFWHLEHSRASGEGITTFGCRLAHVCTALHDAMDLASQSFSTAARSLIFLRVVPFYKSQSFLL